MYALQNIDDSVSPGYDVVDGPRTKVHMLSYCKVFGEIKFDKSVTWKKVWQVLWTNHRKISLLVKLSLSKLTFSQIHWTLVPPSFCHIYSVL